MKKMAAAAVMLVAVMTMAVPAMAQTLEERVQALEAAREQTWDAFRDHADAIGELQTSVEGVREEGRETRRALTDVATSVAELQKLVRGQVKTVRSLNKDVGAMKDMAGVDHRRKYYVIDGFSTGSYTMTPAMGRALTTTMSDIRSGGWNVDLVAGFADVRPWRDRQGSDLNPGLATSRARVVAEHIAQQIGAGARPAKEGFWAMVARWFGGGTDPDSGLQYVGDGATGKFGDLDVNRSAVIFVSRPDPRKPTMTPFPKK